MPDERLPEILAGAICARALLEHRCAELIGVLMGNGSVTIDSLTGELRFFTAAQLGQVVADSFEGCETGLSSVTAAGDYGGDVVVYGLDGVHPNEPVPVDEVDLFARRKTT